jgi:hypothetical protein
MAKSAVMIAPADITLADIYSFLQECWPNNSSYISGQRPQAHVQVSNDGTWYVTFGELTPTEDIREDYADNEDVPEAIKAKLDGKRFYAVSFNDYKFGSTVVRRLLSRFAPMSQDIWLDNDYGVLVPASRVLAELDANPNWDWRSERPAEGSG